MRTVLSVAVGALFATLVTGLSAPPATATERRAIVTEGADYFGLDYQTLKEVDLADCEKACVADGTCKAFTYNTKARWCFLKSSFGDMRAFAGAVSGRIVTGDVAGPDLAARRLAELGFVPQEYVDEARRLAGEIDTVAVDGAFEAIVADADAATAAGDWFRALDLTKMALRLSPEDADLWRRLAGAAVAAESDDWSVRERLRREGTGGAINAYLRSPDDVSRTDSLAALSAAFARRDAWRPAIKAARAGLALTPGDAPLAAALDQLVAEHGFRVTDNTVDTASASPRICAVFTDPLATSSDAIGDFVTVNGGHDFPVEVEANQVCADGVAYGERYRMTLRAGITARDGETLARAVDLDIYVRDRDPLVRFVGRAYVLPAGGEATIPVVSVNVDTIDARVVRIGDRSLAGTIAEDRFLSQMAGYDVDQIADRSGAEVWSGKIDVTRDLNREVTTAVPVGELVETLEPGVYALSARATTKRETWSADATQWFVVTDVGLSTLSASDGLHVFARSLSTAGPVAEAALRLVAVNNEVLGTATTDGEGYARFDAGLTRGTGGSAPALVVAEGEGGDYSFLDLTKAPFDLTDRGVDGRPAPKPVDVFMTTERGVYRPGETVNVTALARDATATAIDGLDLTLVVRRPDGVEQSRELVPGKGAGGHDLAVGLLPGAMRGSWRVSAYTDPKADPLAETTFLVEDFVPERLTFDLAPAGTGFDPDAPGSVPVEARFLYGAPAAGLSVEGRVRVRAASAVPGFPGVAFGLSDEEFEPQTAYLQAVVTDDEGRADLPLAAPDGLVSSRPLEAEIVVDVTDSSGRPVQRTATLPVLAEVGRIGVDPQFDGAVEEGGSARFAVVAVDAEGEAAAATGLRWTLVKVENRFQWYNVDGSWNYQSVAVTSRVADGTIDVVAGERPVVEASVTWGQYRLEIRDPSGTLLPVSYGFEAGWYVAPTAEDTPDAVKVSLDKAKYAVGENVVARIEPRFAGVALVTVVDDRLIAMKTVEVPIEGASVELPVTAEWGPGAYVTATLIRPMDLEARRMPARAIGLSYAEVDPADRVIGVSIETPASPRPREALPIDLTLAGVPAGETAYLTLAAVDVGILNLTRYQTPAPETWYFGQRRLGTEMRDLYGQLIDRMIGVPGVIRSGGDGSGLTRLDGPPPTEKLLAFYQGVTEVGTDGKVHVDVDVPDFNGTVRIMVMAWSKTAVGHGASDVVIRDPVVVTANLPAFLAPGDASRLLLDVTHVDGPAGEMRLDVSSRDGAVVFDGDAARRTVTLAEGGKTEILVPVTAVDVGDAAIDVVLTTPDGTALTKALALGVRASDPEIVRRSEVALDPRGGTLSLGPDLFSDFVPGDAAATVMVGGVSGIDLPGLVRALDTYPYGCAEQITSKALPLVYLDDVILAAGLAGAEPVRERVEQAITAVLANQSSSGSFGLWGPGSGDLWLDAYVADFLTRAREKGYRVPSIAYDLAVTNLSNSIAYASDFSNGGEDVAYALYVLARNGRASIGDLRYYAEVKIDAFGTALAKAQIGAALALYGDKTRAAAVLRNAVGGLGGESRGYRADYGSTLRDGAAILTLVSETGVDALDTGKLARDVVAAQSAQRYTSTQEKAWMLLAVNGMLSGAGKPDLAVGGARHEGVYTAAFSVEDVAGSPITLENRGAAAVTAAVTVRGAPATPEPAGGEGYAIERRYYDLDGYEVDPQAIPLGERLVTVLTVTSSEEVAARLVVDDPLPAGFAIDNPNLLAGSEVPKIDGLMLEQAAARTEFRADRFVAALDRDASSPTRFQLAYMVRAIAPGAFAHPAALVEDMYRPERRAWTDTGRVEVIGPVR